MISTSQGTELRQDHPLPVCVSPAIAPCAMCERCALASMLYHPERRILCVSLPVSSLYHQKSVEKQNSSLWGKFFPLPQHSQLHHCVSGNSGFNPSLYRCMYQPLPRSHCLSLIYKTLINESPIPCILTLSLTFPSSKTLYCSLWYSIRHHLNCLSLLHLL